MLNYLELDTIKTDEAKRNPLFPEPSYNLSSDIFQKNFLPQTQEIYLKKVNISGYKLNRAIVLSMQDVDDMKLIYDSYLNLYGIGNNIQEAINEFVSMLIDLFEELSDDEKNLSENLKDHYNYLKSILSTY
jgi:hypothetical protein